MPTPIPKPTLTLPPTADSPRVLHMLDATQWKGGYMVVGAACFRWRPEHGILLHSLDLDRAGLRTKLPPNAQGDYRLVGPEFRQMSSGQ